jgi:uncharacterized membrane protein YbaN (DUF454 family)
MQVSKITLYKSVGFIFLGLGVIGVFLPLLPTTPFLLVSAACFARSSERWHQWLLANRIFGPIIKDWQDKKCISMSTKIFAILLVVLFGGYSIIFLLSDIKLKILCILLVGTGLFFIFRLKVCKPKEG